MTHTPVFGALDLDIADRKLRRSYPYKETRTQKKSVRTINPFFDREDKLTV